MKFLISVVVLMMLAPYAVAHTSDQRYVDGYIVDLSTAPISPWVGEKMGMSFVFRDPTTGLATSSVHSASFTIDALMREKSNVQEIIFKSSAYPATSGGFASDYTFSEVGTYDLHLTFTDADGKVHMTGFRKQVREGEGSTDPRRTQIALLSIASICVLLGFVLGKYGSKS